MDCIMFSISVTLFVYVASSLLIFVHNRRVRKNKLNYLPYFFALVDTLGFAIIWALYLYYEDVDSNA